MLSLDEAVSNVCFVAILCGVKANPFTCRFLRVASRKNNNADIFSRNLASFLIFIAIKSFRLNLLTLSSFAKIWLVGRVSSDVMDVIE